jgi:hypothetical protein
LFGHVFGRFSVRGVQKHDKKSRILLDQPWYFFGLRGTNQPRRSQHETKIGRQATAHPKAQPPNTAPKRIAQRDYMAIKAT